MTGGITMGKTKLWKEIKRHKELYLILLPLLLFYIIFMYKPMYGITIAFKEFNFRKGITASPWAGFKYFNEMFVLPDFWRAFKNSLIIAFGRIIIEFPIPIILALIINEIRYSKLKRFYQTVFTFPHFLSWIIISGIAINFFGNSGVLNGILVQLGFEKTSLLTSTKAFRGILYGTSIWKEAGWGTIIYLATIAGINPNLYEAAKIDGANKFQQLKAITWPALTGTVVLLLILKIGQTMNLGGFDQVFNMYNSAVYEVADILDTYVYRRTFALGASFSSSAAVGLFKSVINCILLLSCHLVSKRLGKGGII